VVGYGGEFSGAVGGVSGLGEEGVHGIDEGFGHKGFEDGGGAGLEFGGEVVRGPGAAGGDEDADGWGDFEELGEDLVAGEVGEFEVEDGNLEAVGGFAAEVEGGLAGIAGGDVIAAALKESSEEGEQRTLVIHEKDALRHEV
jgi:hypothetical protein